MSAQPHVVLEKILYTASATATGGRAGHVRTSDGTLDCGLSMPKGLGGPETAGTTNPEQLFAAGYAACFGSALGFVARQQKVSPGAVEVEAQVSIGAIAPAGFGLAVELAVTIPDLPREQAQALLEAAHQVCPYSNATRGNIAVTLTLR